MCSPHHFTHFSFVLPRLHVNAWLIMYGQYLFNWSYLTDRERKDLCLAPATKESQMPWKGGICMPEARDLSSVVWGWISKLDVSVLALTASHFCPVPFTDWAVWLRRKKWHSPSVVKTSEEFLINFSMAHSSMSKRETTVQLPRLLVNTNMDVPNITKVHVTIPYEQRPFGWMPA